MADMRSDSQVSSEVAQSVPGTGNAMADAGSDTGTVAGVRIRPSQVTWEMTAACAWKAPPVRRAKGVVREVGLFSTAEAFHLIDDIASMHVPLLALTGGDPLTRLDLFPIIEFAAGRSVRTSLTLLPTPALEPGIIGELKASGLLRIGFWLDGSTPGLNDNQRGVTGLYRRTLDIIGACHEVQLPVQVNTTVSRRNFQDIDAMIELLTRLDVVLWNVFFFVPPSPEEAEPMLSPEDHEEIFAKLYAASRRVHFQIKTTEGQAYQRYLWQQRTREQRRQAKNADVTSYGPKAVNQGSGSVFINYRGEACPSRFLPLPGGDVTRESLRDIYCDSSLFVSLRDSSRLKGKCGRCPVKTVCGGSRARAYVMTGDLFAPDPCCAFEP